MEEFNEEPYLIQDLPLDQGGHSPKPYKILLIYICYFVKLKI